MHTYKEIKKKHYVWEFNGINRLDLRRMGGKQIERKLEEKRPHTPKSPRAGHWQNRVSAVPAQPCLPETTQPPPWIAGWNQINLQGFRGKSGIQISLLYFNVLAILKFTFHSNVTGIKLIILSLRLLFSLHICNSIHHDSIGELSTSPFQLNELHKFSYFYRGQEAQRIRGS